MSCLKDEMHWQAFMDQSDSPDFSVGIQDQPSCTGYFLITTLLPPRLRVFPIKPSPADYSTILNVLHKYASNHC